jgi:mutator protein MutT
MKLIFCSECKADLNKLNDTDYICANGHKAWDNPKAAVTAILTKDGQVLCAKRGVEPSKGKYDFPGGFLNRSERAIDAIKREILEETGLEIIEPELIDSYTHDYDSTTSVSDLIFLVRDWQGEMIAQDDVAELKWSSVSIIDSSDFAWSYPELSAKLRKIL